MKKLVIAVDCDDVLVRSTPFFVETYNQIYGTNVTLDTAHDNAAAWGVDNTTVAARLAELMETQAYKNLSPSNEEVTILNALSKDHELHVITARRPHERDLTQLMLDTYLPGVFRSLELVGFTGSKGEIIKSIHADVLIDDNLRHLNDAVKHGLPKEGAILFGDYAWSTPELTPFVHCYEWSDIAREINRLARL